MPEFLKNKLKDRKSIKSDEDITADNYLNFNSNSSLLARLYEKNKELMNNVLDEKKEVDTTDIIDLISKVDKNVENKENDLVNINNIEVDSSKLKRSTIF